jgi:hypothetical protein
VGQLDQLGSKPRSQERGWAWWGQGLAVLNQQHEGRQLPQRRLDQLQALGAPAAPLQWAMDGGTAQGLLRRWQPWRLLNTLASTPLTPSVEGAALSLEPDGADRRALRLRAQGRSVRPMGASSRLDLSPGVPPTANLQLSRR